MRELPRGTVTFLFTDIEGSTRLLKELGPDSYSHALAEHRRVVRTAVARHGGVEVDTQGDAFFVAFPTPNGAVAAAREASEALSGPVRVRIGIHTGVPHVNDEGYVGEDVHMGARVAAAGHGGQVLLSRATRELVGCQALDLGEHRLKDFAEPVWIFQLGRERFPPLKTISNTNLPRPASSFVGRERETAEVAALLHDGARLVTLSGPGGSGKTRLAIEAAGELVPEFKNGVFWVGLAALRDPALVTETIAQTIGAKDAVADHVGERELLLLLDNLEQVIDAAPQLAAVLETCPNLRLLVTSRELLRVRGEVEYAVPPLAEREAVELFCRRAQLQADETIAELCRRLDNLPLAVELAAARTSVLSPAQILDRLSQRLDLLKGGRDAEARQRTLRATIEWSYELLSPDEQTLFRRLSVFAGGCTLEAAEQVADADLDTLQSLADKSLVRRTGERFWMLETIHEYAGKQLREDSLADEARRRHASYFAALAERLGREVRDAAVEAADQLRADHANVRATLAWLRERGDRRFAEMCLALHPYLLFCGHAAEGCELLLAALDMTDSGDEQRDAVLSSASAFAFHANRLQLAEELVTELLERARRAGARAEISYGVRLLASIAIRREEWGRAQALMSESLAVARTADDSHAIAAALGDMTWLMVERGDFERALELSGDALRHMEELGFEPWLANAYLYCGTAELELGYVDAARESLRQAAQISGRGRFVECFVCAAEGLAAALCVSAGAESCAKATELIGAAGALRNANQIARTPGERTIIERAAAAATQTLGHVHVQAALDRGARASFDDAVALVLSLDSI